MATSTFYVEIGIKPLQNQGNNHHYVLVEVLDGAIGSSPNGQNSYLVHDSMSVMVTPAVPNMPVTVKLTAVHNSAIPGNVRTIEVNVDINYLTSIDQKGDYNCTGALCFGNPFAVFVI